jgi:hypothetical protein
MPLADDLLAVLNNPTHMWSHALKELSVDGQRLFLTLTLLPDPVSSDVLQIAYTSHTSNRSESFLDSLRSLEDSFVAIEKRYTDDRSISFRNPSLQDFANAYLDSNPDWLDTLLSAPKYYEQIIAVFNLAMAQTAQLIDARTRSRKDAPPKYPGIKGWVDRRADKLTETAIKLLAAVPTDFFRYVRKTRFGQLLEITAVYGLPTKKKVLHKLRVAAALAVQPSTQVEAKAMLELLSEPVYRRLLDKLLQDSAAAVMRESILDKDSWKFAILAELDKLLELDSEETWDSWGSDYVEYARQLAEDLADSDDDEDLRMAIDELTSIGTMLGVDLYSEINALEQRRDDLPEGDDYDDIKPSAPVNSIVDSTRLHEIFASLL